MANIFQSNCCQLLANCFTAFAFTCVAIPPHPLMAIEIVTQKNLNQNDINFGIKVEKIYEKVKKAIDNHNTNKIVGYMFDFKQEVEQYTRKKIDIDKSIDRAEKEARDRGQKIDSRYIEAIKKEFNRHDKKYKHRAVWFAQCTELDIPYSSIEADAHFDMNSMMAKSAKSYDKNEVQIEDVPLEVTVGVTVSLCGLFLYFVPLPGCQVAGQWLLNAGFGILSAESLEKWSDYDKEQRR